MCRVGSVLHIMFMILFFMKFVFVSMVFPFNISSPMIRAAAVLMYFPWPSGFCGTLDTGKVAATSATDALDCSLVVDIVRERWRETVTRR